MDHTRMQALPACLVMAVLMCGGCNRADQPEPAPADVKLEGKAFRVSGPYAHKNLSVFLIHSATQDQRKFLTLIEGIKKGLVKITEKGDGQVEVLLLDNRSRLPLYLQEGERLQGGKQDRTLIASLVIPPRSGKVGVPTACIEESRWQEGATGKKFGITVTTALAPKGVRGAGKVENNQGGVWGAVGAQKKTANSMFRAANTNSSANEMLDSPRVRKTSAGFATALKGVLPRHPDAVGMVIAINGEVEEINVYPNHGVLRQFYPRLIQAYALQAMMLKDEAKNTKTLSPAAVARFMKVPHGKSSEQRKIGVDNRLRIRALKEDKFLCTTHYKGKLVHLQIMKKNGAASEDDSDDAARTKKKRIGKLGGDW
jgi:hypothetical protein